MFVFIVRPSRPDALDWPGRRLLAAADAVGWPLAWIALVVYAPIETGIVGAVVVGAAAVAGLCRLHRALWFNHRYWFATWRWGRVALAVIAVGLMIKLTVGG